MLPASLAPRSFPAVAEVMHGELVSLGRPGPVQPGASRGQNALICPHHRPGPPHPAGGRWAAMRAAVAGCPRAPRLPVGDEEFVQRVPRPRRLRCLRAAEGRHHAIRATVGPQAFSGIRGDHPFIELRDPADVARPPAGRLGNRSPGRPRGWPGSQPTSTRVLGRHARLGCAGTRRRFAVIGDPGGCPAKPRSGPGRRSRRITAGEPWQATRFPSPHMFA